MTRLEHFLAMWKLFRRRIESTLLSVRRLLCKNLNPEYYSLRAYLCKRAGLLAHNFGTYSLQADRFDVLLLSSDWFCIC